MKCTSAIIAINCSVQKRSFTIMSKFIQILKETKKSWIGKKSPPKIEVKAQTKKNRVKVKNFQILEQI